MVATWAARGSRYNTINLRLWKAAPSNEFDLSSFNSGDYMKAVEQRQRAETITHVLYPSDKTCVHVWRAAAAVCQCARGQSLSWRV